MSVGNFTIEIEFAAEEKVAEVFSDFIDELARSHSQLAIIRTAIVRRSDTWPPPDPSERYKRCLCSRCQSHPDFENEKAIVWVRAQ